MEFGGPTLVAGHSESAEWKSAILQVLEKRTTASDEDGRVMASVHPSKSVRSRVQFRDKRRDQISPLAAALTHGKIEPCSQLYQGHRVGCEGVETRLDGSHQQSSRDPFARDVGDD